MKKVRKITQRYHIASFLAISVLLFSCKKQTQETKIINKETGEIINSIDVVVPISATGKELFKSIIFVDGIYTNSIPALINNVDVLSKFQNSTDLNNYRQTQIEAMNYIESLNPNYFNSFKSDILSSNPVTILNALTNAQSILIPYLNLKLQPTGYTVEYFVNNNNITPANIESIQSQVECIMGPVLVAAVVVAVLVVIVAMTAFWGPEDPEGPIISTYMELVSASIATNLISQ